MYLDAGNDNGGWAGKLLGFAAGYLLAKYIILPMFF